MREPYKRPLVIVVVAYAVGVWFGRELVPLAEVPSLIIGFAMAIAALIIARRRKESTIVFLAVFAAVGALRSFAMTEEAESAHLLISKLDNGRIHVLSGTIAADPRETGTGRLNIVLKDVKLNTATTTQVPGFMQMSLAPDSEWNLGNKLTPGTRITAAGHIGPVSSFRNFFLYDHRKAMEARRVYGVVRVANSRFLSFETAPAGFRGKIRSSLADVRARTEQIIRRSIPAAHADFALAMLFNNLALLDEQDARAFRDSGTMHIFSVSGMHVAVFAFLLAIILRVLRLPYRWAWTITCIVLFAYVLLLDFIAPAFRAFLMFAAYTAGQWLRREVDNISALTLGAVVILLIEPLALWQASFWLSFLGVSGIIIFVPLFRAWLGVEDRPETRRAAVQRWLLDSLLVSAAVTVMLLPLQLYLFQQFNWLSPLANLFAAVVSFPLLAGVLFTAIAGSISEGLSAITGAATAVLLDMTTFVAHLTADQRWAILQLPRPPLYAVPAYFLLIISGYYFVHRRSPEFILKSRARFAVQAPLAIALLLVSSTFNGNDSKLRIWFLDVGQGDATLIQFPTGETLLVDAGNFQPDLGRLVVVPQLQALAFTHLGTLLATHEDADHMGGIPYVLRNWRVNSYAEGTSTTAPGDLRQSVAQALRGSGTTPLLVAAGYQWKPAPDISLEVLHPAGTGAGGEESTNARSVVLRITHGKFTALLMGDAEESAEMSLVENGIGKCDVLKAGHHGSRTSSTERFIAATKPAVAIISCGRKNRYGHPAPDVVERFGRHDAKVYRTDLQGAILVESDGSEYKVQPLH